MKRADLEKLETKKKRSLEIEKNEGKDHYTVAVFLKGLVKTVVVKTCSGKSECFQSE